MTWGESDIRQWRALYLALGGVLAQLVDPGVVSQRTVGGVDQALRGTFRALYPMHDPAHLFIMRTWRGNAERIVKPTRAWSAELIQALWDGQRAVSEILGPVDGDLTPAFPPLQGPPPPPTPRRLPYADN